MTESNPCIFGPLLGPLHDGELSADRRQEVLEHLESCPHCPAELADIRRFAGVLSAASTPMLPAGRMEAIFAESSRLAAEPEPTTSPAGLTASQTGVTAEPLRLPASGHIRYVRWISGAAAAVFLLAMGQLFFTQPAGNPVGPKPGDPAVHTNPATQKAPEKAPNPQG